MAIVLDITATYGLGVVGMVAHWAKRWKKGETITTLSQYVLTNKLATAKAILATIVGVSTAIGTGADYHTLNGIGLLFMAGYGADSLFNKDTEDTRTIPEKMEAVEAHTANVDTLNITDKG